ncbi:WD repeat-containing protein 13-like [Paramacrobiotus metropolitanus]|uniref:WD repeat-containing protein 13-like n=1 Tax=Paramacrobiotus metropolitanus TaxID=2943436 RepID=UPI0024457985|nr:WD repeat-containing protein 13-like [Paramacrobiotus metropolitanus]
MSISFQQIVAVDARYSLHRLPQDPQFRTLYIRRRSQLLRQVFKSDGQMVSGAAASSLTPDEVRDSRKTYLHTRLALLAKKYGSQMDNRSVFGSSGKNSRCRSISRSTINSRLPEDGSDEENTVHSANFTTAAVAAPKKSAETYAFSGVQHIFDQHKKAVGSVRFAGDDKHRLACCSADGMLSVIMLLPSYAEGESPYSIQLLKGHTDEVTDFSWGTSGDLIVSCSLDGSVRLWDTYNATCLRTVHDHFRCGILSCTFHPRNNNFVVTGNERGFLQVLNVSTGKFLSESLVKTNGRVLCMCFDAVSSILWIGNDNATLFSFLFDVLSSKFILIKQIHLSSKNVAITSISALTTAAQRGPLDRGDEKLPGKTPLLLLNCSGNALLLFQIKEADLRRQQLILKRRFIIRQKKFRIRSSFCARGSAAGQGVVVSGSEDGRVMVYDADKPVSKACVNELQGHSAAVLDVCFNLDESLLASCDANGIVIIWKRVNKAGNY